MNMPLSYRHANMVFAEHPVGDPFSGAAYGKKEKSKGLGMVIGVVAGIATGGAGWGMMGAGKGLLANLAGGAMFAGGIASSLGAITGNKKLAKVGTVLSLAGGVGSLVNDGLALAAGEAGASFGKTAADGWASTMADLEGAFGSIVGQGSSATSGASQTIGLDSMGGGSGLTAGAGSQSLTGGLIETSMAPDTSLVGGFSGAGGTGLQAGNPAASTIGLTSGAPSSAGAGKGILSNVMDFAKSSPGQNLIGNMLQGAAQGDVAQQELDLLAQKYSDNRAELERQLQNVNFRYEVIDPSDPQAEQKRAAAKAQGVPTITLGVNQNAAPVQPIGAQMNANQMKVA